MKDYSEEIIGIEEEILSKNKLSEEGDVFVGRLSDGTRYICAAKLIENSISIATTIVKDEDIRLIERQWDVEIKEL